MSQSPLNLAGKLFYTKPDGGDYSCSAQLIRPGVLITAAHCLRSHRSPGRWYQNFIYVHQYDRGNGTRVPVECYGTKRGWISDEDLPENSVPNDSAPYDYGFIKLRGFGNRGYFGWEYGWWGKYTNVPKIGYPGAIAQGQVIQVDFGRLIKGWSPEVVGLAHGNPRNAEGSSGGAWVGNYGSNAEVTRVLTVTSHHMGDDRGTSYGPYWNDGMVSLMDHVGRGCPGASIT